MVTTGANYYYELGDTEAYVVPSLEQLYVNDEMNLARCQTLPYQTQSMYPIQEATGGVLAVESPPGPPGNTTNSKQMLYLPIVCGGFRNEMFNGNCYHVDHKGSSTLPTVVGVLKEMRIGAASIVILNGTTLWVTGGRHGGDTATTEWLNVSMALSTLTGTIDSPASLSQGIPLPRPMSFHCLEKINRDTAILYGGFTAHGELWYKTTWTIDNLDHIDMNVTEGDINQMWTTRADMLNPRFYHCCGVIKVPHGGSTNWTRKYVVAAGGQSLNADAILDTVELLEIKEYHDQGGLEFADVWKQGPAMPRPLTDAASVTSPDQSILFVTGGYEGEDYLSQGRPSNSIYGLRCAFAKCWWTIQKLEMEFTRLVGVAMMTPPQIKEGKYLTIIWIETIAYISVHGLEVKCSETRIGDGLCDAVNNNIRCVFDGGDCCSGGDGECLNCFGGWCNCHETEENFCPPSSIYVVPKIIRMDSHSTLVF